MSQTPWELASIQYAGWIPNALGHLSFSLIGQGTRPKAYAAAREGHADGQHVIAHHTRVVGDYALPNWIMRWFRLGAVHDWLLVGSTAPANYPSSKKIPAVSVFVDDRGMLRGTIYFLAQINRELSTRRQRWRTRWLRWRFLGNAKRITRELIGSHGKHPLPEKYNCRMEALIRIFEAKRLQFTHIHFALIRTGEARFWVEENVPFENDRSRDAAIKSAYLFLKDVTHRHVHHHHSQDSLLPLVRIRPGGEIEWQRQTIWALSRSIEDNIRRCRRKTLRGALGMIPFAENFHALYSGLMRSPDGRDGFKPVNNLDHYSYEALRKSVTIQLETRSWWLAGMTAVTASFFAITLSAVIAIKSISSDGRPDWPDYLASTISVHPAWTVVIVWAGLWICVEAIYREAMVDTSPFMFVRFARRFALATTVSLYRWIGLPRVAPPIIEFAVQFAGFAAALSVVAYLLGLW